LKVERGNTYIQVWWGNSWRWPVGKLRKILKSLKWQLEKYVVKMRENETGLIVSTGGLCV
jgi:hypothetical protein